ncbi:MAG: hypothetical protein QG622_2969 [Actinomycetota bacterium]|nr:hypothetical protein [Actinomycetota bacterium]
MIIIRTAFASAGRHATALTVGVLPELRVSRHSEAAARPWRDRSAAYLKVSDLARSVRGLEGSALTLTPNTFESQPVMGSFSWSTPV